MKKIIKSFLCIFTVLTAFCAVSAAAQQAPWEILLQLGVVSETPGEEPLTREKAALLFSGMCSDALPQAQLQFSDVSEYSPYYSAISRTVSAGIMTGAPDGTFRPGENISYTDFLVTAVRWGGFEKYAAVTGGYPNGYIKIADRYDLVNGKNNLNGSITEKEACEILAEALMMPYCRINSIISENGTQNEEYDISSDYTCLNHYFRVERKEATVTAVNEIYLRGYTPCSYGMVSLLSGGKTGTYPIKLSNCEKYLGCQVYSYINTDTDEVIFLESRREIEQMSLDYGDIESVSRDRTLIKYSIDGNSGEIELPVDVTIIYNGMNAENINAADLHKKNVRLSCIDTDDDNTYEVLFVEEYENIVVMNYNAADETVRDRFTNTEYNLSSEDFKYGVYIELDGAQAVFGNIGTGDILSIMTDKSGKKRTVYVSKSYAEGIVDSVSSDDNLIGVDGKEYELFSDEVINVGDNVRIGFDRFGNAVTIQKMARPEALYAYLIKVEEDAGLSNDIKIKYADSMGNVKIADFCESFRVNNQKGDYDKLITALSQNATLHQLVKLEFSENKVKRIYTANLSGNMSGSGDYEGFTLNYEAQSGTDLFYKQSIGAKYFAAAQTVTFFIPIDDYGEVYEEEIYAGDFEQISFAYALKPHFMVYDSTASRIPRALVVYGEKGGYVNSLLTGRLGNNNVFVVEKKYYGTDKDGVDRVYLQGMLLGMQKVMYAPDGKDFADVKPGDVIRLKWYRGNELHTYDKLFTLNSQRSDADTVLAADKSYSDSYLAYNKRTYTSKFDIIGVYGEIVESGIAVPSTSASYQTDRKINGSFVIRPMDSAEDEHLVTLDAIPITNNDQAGTYVYLFDKSQKCAYFVNYTDIELSGREAYCCMYEGSAKAIVIYE